MIASPDPDKRVSQGLLEDAAVAVAGAKAVDEPVVVALGGECCVRAFAGHDPVVVGFFGVLGAEVIFGDVSEYAEGLGFAALNEFHIGVVFPGAPRVFGLFWCVVVLLGNEGAGIGDDAAVPVGPEPAHGEGGGAT